MGLVGLNLQPLDGSLQSSSAWLPPPTSCPQGSQGPSDVLVSPVTRATQSTSSSMILLRLPWVVTVLLTGYEFGRHDFKKFKPQRGCHLNKTQHISWKDHFDQSSGGVFGSPGRYRIPDLQKTKYLFAGTCSGFFLFFHCTCTS